MPLALIDFSIGDEECTIEVTDYESVSPWRGSPHDCPSADDYYGYVECYYNIIPVRLEDEVTHAIDARIVELIKETMEGEL